MITKVKKTKQKEKKKNKKAKQNPRLLFVCRDECWKAAVVKRVHFCSYNQNFIRLESNGFVDFHEKDIEQRYENHRVASTTIPSKLLTK